MSEHSESLPSPEVPASGAPEADASSHESPAPAIPDGSGPSNGSAPSNGRVYQSLVINDTAYQTTYTKKYARRKRYTPPDPRRITAFIPGVILKVSVKDGQMVKRGDPLLVLQAMKMENELVAPLNGKIKGVYVAEGDSVSKGQLLLEFH